MDGFSKFPCFSKCFAPGSLLFSPLGYYPPVVAFENRNGNKYANLEIGWNAMCTTAELGDQVLAQRVRHIITISLLKLNTLKYDSFPFFCLNQ